MKKYYTLIFAFFGIHTAYSQLLWQKSYGGSGLDLASSVQQTGDGGFIIAGKTCSPDGNVSGLHGSLFLGDFWVLKLSASGDLLWQKCLGGSNVDQATSVALTNDGGYIVAGLSWSNDGDVSGNNGKDDFWIVKLSVDGTIQWQKNLGGTGSDEAYAVTQTADSSYLVVGMSNSNDGNVSGNHGSYDAWLVKLSVTGDIKWQKCLGGSDDDRASSVIPTSDTGCLIVGLSASNDGDVSGNHGSNDYWIVKLSQSGAIQWQKSLGGSQLDEARSVTRTTDGGYVVVGLSTSNDGDVSGNYIYGDAWVIKLSPAGDLLSQYCFGGAGESVAYSVAATTDSGVIISGLINDYSNSWVFKLSSSLSMEWQAETGAVNYASTNYVSNCVQQTTDGNYIFAGAIDQDSTGSFTNVYVAKLGRNAGVPNVLPPGAFSVYPNPTTGSFTLRLPQTNTPAIITITDILGSTIETRTTQNTQPQNLNFDLHIPPGTYVVKISSGDNIYRQKIQIW